MPTNYDIELKRNGISGTSTGATYTYILQSKNTTGDTELNNDELVKHAVADNLPVLLPDGHPSGFIVTGVSVQQIVEVAENVTWLADVEFAFPGGGGLGSAKRANVKLSLEAGLESVKVLRSIATSMSKPATGIADADKFKSNNWINVDQDGNAQGVSLPRPISHFTAVVQFVGEIPKDYIKRLGELMGKVNSKTFQGNWPAGEVRMESATGSTEYGVSEAKSEVQVRFAQRPNKEDVVIPGYTEKINVKGWEYVWEYHKKEDDENGTKLVPHTIFVEEVFETEDLNDALDLAVIVEDEEDA